MEADPPRSLDAEAVESATVQVVPVPGIPEPGFAGFLDGRQESRVVGWVDPFAPLVYGTVAAGILRREDRRLRSWRPPEVARRMYAPLRLLPDDFVAVCHPLAVADTSPEAHEPPHPALLTERARQAVAADREAAEHRMAVAWCEAGAGPLYVDGGIAGNEILATAPDIVGVVKSHRTFYGGIDAMRLVLGLQAGERTTVVRIAPRGRRAVHSWYLRLRDPAGHDAMWALVRIEAAESGDPRGVADRVSRWVLAESAPLAAPDPRWDRMAYGVRAVEQMLAAATGVVARPRA